MAWDVMLIIGYLGTGLVMAFIARGIKETEGEGSDIMNPFLTFIKIALYAVAFYMIILNFSVMRQIVIHEANITEASLQGNLTNLIGTGYYVSFGTTYLVIILLVIMFIATLFGYFIPMISERRRMNKR